VSLIEDYSHVAVVEMLSVLRKMREHCGPEFQITSKTINKTLVERFGITYQGAGRKLFRHVVDVLLGREILTIWDVRTRNKTNLTIYQVNTFALMNSGTRGALVSGT
jgi:hypothetical protein